MKKSLILSIILIVLGIINCSLVLLFGLFGSFMCGKIFYMISGSNDSIPACVPIFSTDFVLIILLGIVLLLIGIILMIFRKRKYEKN